MEMKNLTITNVKCTESSSKENKLETLDDINCDYMNDLCKWLDNKNVNWKEKVTRILEECKKVEGLNIISNNNIFIPIKNIFDVKSIYNKSDYYDYETDIVMNSFCVQRLRFDLNYSPIYNTFSAVIYILEDGRFFVHHNYKDKELLDNSIGFGFLSDYITNDYSDLLHFLLFSKKSIEEITSGINSIKNFVSDFSYKNDVIVNDNKIYFGGYDLNIELKFNSSPKIDSLIKVADVIYEMKKKYEIEKNQR